jgi:hypothetical protein
MHNESIKVKLMVDCNCNYLGFDKPTLSSFEIEYFSLKEGDKVIGFQDEQEWEGIVRKDPTLPEDMQWYLELDLQKESLVSEERQVGRDEGFRSALPIGEIGGEMAVATAMIADGIDIEVVMKYSRLSKDRLIHIKNRLTNHNKQ